MIALRNPSTSALALAAALMAPVTVTRADTPLIRSGINEEILSAALDPGDMKIVLENIIKTALFGDLRHQSALYPNSDALMRGLERDEFDVFAMTTIPYIKNIGRAMEPAMVLQSNGKKTQQYVLLANAAESAGKTLADFRGAEVAVIDNGVNDLIHIWLDVALGRIGLPKGEDYFGTVVRSEKPNEAAIPVYFGKRDLCLISTDHWQMLAELNPKMKERLRVVATSPEMVVGLLLFRAGLAPDLKVRSRDALLRLHESPEGEQILRFGQIEKLVPVAEGDMDSALDIYEEYQQLGRSLGEPADLVSGNNNGEPN